MKIFIIKYRIYLIFIFFSKLSFAQSPEELKRFMETYDKIKVDQQANEIVKKGIESEKDPLDRPVKLLVSPSDINKYYREKMNVLKSDIKELNNLLIYSDSVPPINDFGYNFFLLRDSIQIVDNRKITSDYILGYGDEIIISVWGQVEQYEKKIIQRDGTVYVENVGLLYLDGMNLSVAKEYIYNRFTKVYSTLNSKPQLTFLDISLGRLKNINVVISGHVSSPGNYVINPSLGITNLLIKSGGILKTGSLRSIYHFRNNALIDTIDLYPLISGTYSIKDVTFFDNDIIVVPSKGYTVAVTGCVRMPAYYEIINENVSSIVEFAGGLTRKSKPSLYLFRNSKPNLIIKRSNFDNLPLTNGDSLYFPSIELKHRIVTVSVDNQNAKEIPWLNNLSYDDIFQAVDVDISNIKKIELVRRINNDQYETYLLQNFDGGDFEFLPFDYITIQLNNSFKKINTITVKGSIYSPGVYPLAAEKETLSSIINRSGGLYPSLDLSNVIVKRDTLEFGSIDGSLILSPGDTVLVKPAIGTVILNGEIHNPGLVEWKFNRTARDYLNLAGGLTSYGDKKHITYISPYGEAKRIRQNSRIFVLPGSKIIVSRKPINELDIKPDRFQQISSLISSLVTIAILANSTNQGN